MKQAKFYIGLTLFTIVLLSVLRVVMTNNISTNGIDLGMIQEEVESYKKQNALIHEQVLEMSSLNYIASRASQLGFVESKTQMVISEPLPIALKQ